MELPVKFPTQSLGLDLAIYTTGKALTTFEQVTLGPPKFVKMSNEMTKPKAQKYRD